MKLKSIHRVERVAWRGRGELGLAWEWVEDNLDMRAASIRRDKGEGVIPGDLRPPRVSCGAIQMVSWVVGVVGGVWTE